MTTTRRLLLELLAPQWRWIGASILLSFGVFVCGLALTASAAYLLSRAAITTDIASLAIVLAAVRVFAIARAALRYVERLVSHAGAFRLSAELRSWFFAAIEPLAPARLSGHHSGDLLARSVSDIQTIEGFSLRVLVPATVALLGVVLVGTVLSLFDLHLGVVAVAVLIASATVPPLATKRLAARSAHDQIDAAGKLSAMLVDEIEGAADLRVFDADGRLLERLLALEGRIAADRRRVAAVTGAASGLAALLSTACAVAVLLIAVPMVGAQQIDRVYLALLVLVPVAGFAAVQALPEAVDGFESSAAAASRVFELTAQPALAPVEVALTPPHSAVSIAFDDVSFRYAPDEPLVLDGASFSVAPGQTAVLIGPSGAGKSTVVNLLLRFWDCDGGRVRVGGVDTRECGAEVVRALIGVMPQDIHLFNASIRDNLLLARGEATDAQLADACRIVLLHDFIQSLPRGYDTQIGQDGLLLSGGERQRLALARVILKDAPIVTLDEPTANLDQRTESALFDSLEPFLRGRTTLIISHRETVQQRFDAVYCLVQGRIERVR